MAENKKCAHPSCNCHAREGNEYCSVYCEGAGTAPDIQCGCGHTECSGSTKLAR